MLKDRLLIFIKFLKLSVSGFESIVGLSNGFVSKTNDNIRRRTLDAIASAFPQLNIEWLRTGEGEMLLPQEPSQESSAKAIGHVYSASEKDDDVIMVNFIPVSARASFIDNLYIPGDYDDDKYPIVPRTGEKEAIDDLVVFEVDGSSMEPTLRKGAIILTKQIPETLWHTAEGVVVVVYSEFVVVKRVAKNELLTGNKLTLSSDNPAFGSMTLQLSDIRAIYKAKRKISEDID